MFVLPLEEDWEDCRAGKGVSQCSLASDLQVLPEHVDSVDYCDWENTSHMLPAALPAAALRSFRNRGVLGSFAGCR